MTTRRKSKTSDNLDITLSKGTNQGTPTVNLLNSIKIDIKPKTPSQKELVKSIKDNEITICSGVAGTGKTFLTCAEALKMLKSTDTPYNKIVLVKSVTTLKDEDLGFLKGDLLEKMQPFMESFFGNIEKLTSKYILEKLREYGLIEIKPIAYLRGVNIDNSIVIIDEAQNITISNMRTILTRIGNNSKMIFLGDEKQIDLVNKKDSCLKFMLGNFDHIKGFGSVQLDVNDIIRNPIIREIENVFDVYFYTKEQERLKEKELKDNELTVDYNQTSTFNEKSGTYTFRPNGNVTYDSPNETIEKAKKRFFGMF